MKIIDNFLNKSKVEHSVEDIDIVDIIDKSTYISKMSRYNNMVVRKYFNGEFYGLLDEKRGNRFAFQDILMAYNMKTELGSGDYPLIIASSIISVSLEAHEKDYYKEKGLPVPKDKEAVRFFIGSAHKPYTKDFYTTFDCPIDILREEKDNTAIDDIGGGKSVSALCKIKFETLLKIFNKINTHIILLVGDEEIEEYLMNLFDDINLDICQDIKVEENIVIKEIFNKIEIYEKVKVREQIKIGLVVFILLAIYQVFNYTNNNTAQLLAENEKEISDIKIAIFQKEGLRKKLQQTLDREIVIGKSFQRKYVEGEKYDY